MKPPGYWMHETSGALRPAVEAFLLDEPMTEEQIAAMRAYLRQWIAGDWVCDRQELDRLRASVDGLTTRRAISDWIDFAVEEGIDPL